MTDIEHVFVIVLDTVRAESTSVDGREITPALAELAEDGTVFQRAITPAPWTLPAHASIYTGQYPTEHGVRTQQDALSTTGPTLAELLSEEGFRTGLFTPNIFLTDAFRMDRGFEEVRFIQQEASTLFDEGIDPVSSTFTGGQEDEISWVTAVRRSEHRAKSLANLAFYKFGNAFRRHYYGTSFPPLWDEYAMDAAVEFAKANVADGRRSFGFANLAAAHGPWQFDRDRLAAIDVHPEDLAPVDQWKNVAAQSECLMDYAAGEVTFDEVEEEILTKLYESWVHYVDGLVGEFRSRLEQLGIAEQTLLVVTADHGEAIAGEEAHGHSVTLEDDVTHVPLVVSGPEAPDDTVTEPVSLKDLYGTVLSMVDIDVDARSLYDEAGQGVALSETEGKDPSMVPEGYRDVCKMFGRRRRLITPNGWVERRYDTGETHGNAELEPELAAFVDELDPTTDNEQVDSEDIDEVTRQRLSELGYR